MTPLSRSISFSPKVLLVKMSDKISTAFSQNDASLAFNLLFTEGAVGQDVRQDLNSFIHITIQTLGIENSLFSAGVSIKMSSHSFNLKFKTCLRSFASSLKGHVLKEVCNSII